MSRSQYFTNAIVALAFSLSACSGGSGGDPRTNGNGLNDIQVYDKTSAHSSVLVTCAQGVTSYDSCTLEELPIIGLETDSPTIGDIMARVVVSHTWMGDRFQEVLEALPVEMLELFTATTAIVIDADIRPSFYYSGTGAIYIDPAYLWQTLAEKRTINTQQDYRSEFDDPLQFKVRARYMKNDNYAYQYWPLTDDQTRTLNDLILPATRVLLHELAHANDFIPPGSYASLTLENAIVDEINALENSWISTRLDLQMPLQSETLFGLAEVMYHGHLPNFTEKAISAAQVGTAFEPDAAVDDYSYSSQFEDVAMLFEVSLMKYFHNIDYESAFTTEPDHAYYCDDIQIGWGVKNRVGDLKVKERAQFIVEEMIPDTSFALFFQNMSEPDTLAGNWCISLTTERTMSASGGVITHAHPVSEQELIRPYD